MGLVRAYEAEKKTHAILIRRLRDDLADAERKLRETTECLRTLADAADKVLMDVWNRGDELRPATVAAFNMLDAGKGAAE